MEPEFKSFEKIGRLNRDVVVTEKIDGTNGLVWIADDLSEVRAGSRNRWITPTDDNFGFAGWVAAHADELKALGPGYHYGEWWGLGIQRRYDLPEKRWSLFNVARWEDDALRPACCHVVPVLHRGHLGGHLGQLERLRHEGSVAAPGFMRPEGVVIFHTHTGQLMKVTLEGDEKPKGL